MAIIVLDACGLKGPQPVLRVAAKAPEMSAGDTLEVLADCPTFAADILSWCERTKRTLLFCRDEGGGRFRAQVRF